MKNKKLIIGIIIGVLIVIVSLLTLVIVNNVKKGEKFEESDYITKGQYFEKFIEENNLYSDIYSEEEIKNAEDYEIDAAIMVEWELITEEQAKNPEKPLTKEIVAQSISNIISFRETHNIKINDIDKCYDKQAIMDSVGMGIFELDNGNFYPNQYMTYDDIDIAFEKMNEFEREVDFSDEPKEAKIDWSGLDLTIAGVDYIFPLKVSYFINNGWVAESTEFEEILNKTIDEDFLPSGDEDIYVGFNYISLKQNDLQVYVYFDINVMNTKVMDANVTYFEIKRLNENSSDNFNFYGVEFGTSEDRIVDLFGTKNYRLTDNEDDDYFSYIYYGTNTENDTVGLDFGIDKKTKKLIKFGIGFY